MARDGGMSELTSPAATVEESGTPQASDDDAEQELNFFLYSQNLKPKLEFCSQNSKTTSHGSDAGAKPKVKILGDRVVGGI